MDIDEHFLPSDSDDISHETTETGFYQWDKSIWHSYMRFTMNLSKIRVCSVSHCWTCFQWGVFCSQEGDVHTWQSFPDTFKADFFQSEHDRPAGTGVTTPIASFSEVHSQHSDAAMPVAHAASFEEPAGSESDAATMILTLVNTTYMQTDSSNSYIRREFEKLPQLGDQS